MKSIVSQAIYRVLSLTHFLISLQKRNRVQHSETKRRLQIAFNYKNNATTFRGIEKLRRSLLQNDQLLKRKDYGAGSALSKTNKQKIKNIARLSLSTKRQCLFIASLSGTIEASNILELGTSLGISTAYLAKANPNAEIISIDGDPGISELAKKHFQELKLKNIRQLQGSFRSLLPGLLGGDSTFDFIYIDGDHTCKSTLEYYKLLKDHLSPGGIMVLDDIHWSADMEKAWNKIVNLKNPGVFIELYFMGVYFNHEDDSIFSESYKMLPGLSWLF